MNKEFEELRKSWLDFENFKKEYQKVEVEEYPNNVLKAVPKPEITVRITTYQHALYIRETIESVLKQKLTVPWEIIIGEDESTDGTREICIEYAKQFPDLIRLFLHKRENNIQILGKPCGIFQVVYNTFKARGKYISSLSGDDYWTSDCKLANQYKFLESRPKISMVYTPVKSKKIFDNGEVEFSNIREGFAYPCTVMGRNLFHNLPEEMLKSLNEDNFFNAIYAQYGKSRYITNAGHSVMHHHGKNLWAGGNKETKGRHYINTNLLLYRVFGEFKHSYKRGLASRLVKRDLNTSDVTYKEKIKDIFKKDKWLYVYYLFYKISNRI